MYRGVNLAAAGGGERTVVSTDIGLVQRDVSSEKNEDETAVKQKSRKYGAARQGATGDLQ
ncbi:hypothetical protein VM1G_11670 [Cytospora mali]|uniref:Uncharacterized protein n=1 Tax=Cytospora mali TaxID=578113 RepID=A0A194W3W0_CYTMA|nr:hypothetical protein VM1G_11670 [Valsa mali]